MDKTLTAKLLPAALICKGFITGMADCDYEIYLREVVNASIYFKSKSDGQVYTAPPDESHGEWDCISENYSLDFKLIASETALRARNLFSDGIYQMAEGVTAYCGPKVDADNPKYKPIQATRIFAALRSIRIWPLSAICSGVNGFASCRYQARFCEAQDETSRARMAGTKRRKCFILLLRAFCFCIRRFISCAKVVIFYEINIPACPAILSHFHPIRPQHGFFPEKNVHLTSRNPVTY